MKTLAHAVHQALKECRERDMGLASLPRIRAMVMDQLNERPPDRQIVDAAKTSPLYHGFGRPHGNAWPGPKGDCSHFALTPEIAVTAGLVEQYNDRQVASRN